jgi:hypothetical protein
MSKKKRSCNKTSLMKIFSDAVVDESIFNDFKNEKDSSHRGNDEESQESSAAMMERAYRNRQLSKDEWKNWKETLEFCKRHE